MDVTEAFICVYRRASAFASPLFVPEVQSLSPLSAKSRQIMDLYKKSSK